MISDATDIKRENETEGSPKLPLIRGRIGSSILYFSIQCFSALFSVSLFSSSLVNH